jgi:hypothetical protein
MFKVIQLNVSYQKYGVLSTTKTHIDFRFESEQIHI